MTSLEKAVRTLLLADATIAAAVGARLYGSRMPQGVQYPAIVIHRISASRVRSLAGPSGYAIVRVQLDVWAVTYEQTKEIGDRIRAVLDGYAGTVEGVQFGNAEPVMEQDDFDGDVEAYRLIQDWMIGHREV